MKRTWANRADTRPLVLVSPELERANDTKNLAAYFRIKFSKDLKADYVFTGVHSIGSLAAVTLDLRRWDGGMEILDMIEQLQSQEELFVQKLMEAITIFQTCVAVVMTGQEASRRRFMKLQERIRRQDYVTELCPSKLMIIPVDNKHGVAEELVEVRNSFCA